MLLVHSSLEGQKAQAYVLELWCYFFLVQQESKDFIMLLVSLILPAVRSEFFFSNVVVEERMTKE